MLPKLPEAIGFSRDRGLFLLILSILSVTVKEPTLTLRTTISELLDSLMILKRKGEYEPG